MKKKNYNKGGVAVKDLKDAMEKLGNKAKYSITEQKIIEEKLNKSRNKKAGGGMMKSKNGTRKNAMGGGMMKKKNYAKGGMMNKKNYAKGGKVIKGPYS